MPKRGHQRRAAWIFLPVLAVAFLLAALLYRRIPSADRFARENPRTTALMEIRAAEARAHHQKPRRLQTWMPLSRFSAHLVNAVLDSEDARFYEHEGIDFIEVEHAFSSAIERGKLGRGASTVTQQLAKNLWLSERRSLWRKGEEAILARRLEVLGKDRVLEIYLNVVEWGDGVYGAEAAARIYFDKSALDLDPAEAALLAAVLPSPRRRDPRNPSPTLAARARAVLALQKSYGQIDADEFSNSSARLELMLRGSTAATEP